MKPPRSIHPTKPEAASLPVFSNWRNPSPDRLALEFEIEHELKGCRFWNDQREFMQAVAIATCEKITAGMDAAIAYRSRTRSKDQLLALIKSYKSYPAFRNEATLDAIYAGFKNNRPMDRPLLVESGTGARRVFSGNTRLDVAFQLGIEPEVLVVKSPYHQSCSCVSPSAVHRHCSLGIKFKARHDGYNILTAEAFAEYMH